MRYLLLALAVLVLAGLAWFLASTESGSVTSELGPDIVVGEEPTSTEEVGLEAAGLVAEPDRASVQPVDVVVSPAVLEGAQGEAAHPWEGQLAGVAGRLLEADGEPAVGLPVMLLEFSIDSVFDQEAVARPHEYVEAGESVTGADGRFLIDGGMGRGVHGLGIDVGGARSTVRVIEQSLSYGDVTDIGDIVLPATGTVVGLVIDDDGEPVEGARVRFAVMPDLVAQAGMFDIRSDAALAVPEGQSVQVMPIPAWAGSLIDRFPLSTGYTNVEGEFRLEGVPVGRVVGGADHAGFTAALAEPFELEAGAEHDVDELELLLGRTAKGRVVDAVGQPVPGAQLMGGTMSAILQVGFLHPSADTGEDGRFAVTGLSDIGDVAVAARRSARDPWASVVTSRAPTGLTITLEQASDATIELLDAETGEPVEGAELQLRSEVQVDRTRVLQMLAVLDRGAIEPSLAQPIGEGKYLVEALPLGDWTLIAHAPGYAPLEAQFTHASPALTQSFTMEGGQMLHFRAIDHGSGEPVVGAHLSLLRGSPTRFWSLASGWTDSVGAAQLGPIATDESLRTSWGEGFLNGGVSLVAQHPDYGRQVVLYPAPDPSPTDPPAPFELELYPAVSLKGRIAWDGAAPAVRYMTFLQHDGVSGELGFMALTDADGYFEFKGLSPGHYRIDFSERFLNRDPLRFLEGDSGGRATLGPTVVIDGEPPAFVQIDLSPTGEELPGRIEGSAQLNGVPLVGARILIGHSDPDPVYTDGSGHFETGDLEGTYHTVRLEIPSEGPSAGEPEWESLASRTLSIHGGAVTRLEFDLVDSEMVLRVVGDESDMPIEGANVHYKGAVVAKTNAEGIARASIRGERGVAPEPNVALRVHGTDVTVKADGRVAVQVAMDEPTAAASLDTPVEVRLRRQVPCKGSVVRPLDIGPGDSGAWIVLESHGGGRSMIMDYVSVDAETLTFDKPDLVPGEYQARFQQGSERSGLIRFVLPEEGATDLLLDFSDA